MTTNLDDEFPFPFRPYPMQIDVMRAIRSTITSHRIGVIESPTGTGKSLMLLNAVLSTVFPRRSEGDDGGKANSFALNDGSRKESAPHGKKMCRRRGGGRRVAADSDLLDQEDERGRGRKRDRSSSSDSSGNSSDIEDDEVVPVARPKVYFCSRTHTQLAQLGEELRRTVFTDDHNAKTWSPAEHRVWPVVRFVHVASRAQLCVNRRIRQQSSNGIKSEGRLNDLCRDAIKINHTKEGHKQVKAYWQRIDATVSTTGGARSSNTSRTTTVRNGAISDIEALGELVKQGCLACPYAAPRRIKILKDYARIRSRTADELRQLGEEVGACPYLATKELVREAHVVFLPYSYVVDPTARSQLLPDSLFQEGDIENGHQDTPTVVGVRGVEAFRDNVVVFDEAHHVSDVARRNLCCTIVATHLKIAQSLLEAYSDKYESRLLARNKAKLRELIAFCTRLVGYIQAPQQQTNHNMGISHAAEGEQQPSLVLPLVDVLFAARIDHINPLVLMDFLDNTSLVHKLPSTALLAAQRDAAAIVTSRHHPVEMVVSPWGHVLGDLAPFVTYQTANSSTMMEGQVRERLHHAAQLASYHLLSVLQVLGNAEAEDCVVLHPPTSSTTTSSATLQIVALRGASVMSALFDAASAVVFAGGTMQPLPMLVDAVLPQRPLHVAAATERGGSGCLRLVNPTPSAPPGAVCPTPSVARPYCTNRGWYDHYTFPHVVPPSALRVLTLPSGPSGRSIELTHGRRAEYAEQFDDIARSLLNLSRVIPHGLIVCFTSYAIEEAFFQRAAASGLLDQLSSIKRVFREQRSAAAGIPPRTPVTNGSTVASGGGASTQTTEELLASYTNYVEGGQADTRIHVANAPGEPSHASAEKEGKHTAYRGALLSCVMGGKLSEGINFNDHLGRGVVIVGLPYPNPSDVELNLQLAAAAASVRREGTGEGPPPSTTRYAIEQVSTARNALFRTRSRDESALYQDVCMRAVNQSMGRCIRHASDYAVIILMDQRYQQPAVLGKVSAWMQRSLMPCDSFGSCFRAVREFFESRTKT